MELNDLFSDFLSASVNDVVTALNLSENFTEDDSFQNVDTHIICSLGVTGNKMDANFSFCFDMGNAVTLVSKMLCMDVEEGSPDVFDGVGELVNMVIGGVKNRFTSTEYNFELSIPTLVRGAEIILVGKGTEFIRIKKKYICGEIQFGIIVDYKVSEEKVAIPEQKIEASDRLESILKKNQEMS